MSKTHSFYFSKCWHFKVLGQHFHWLKCWGNFVKKLTKKFFKKTIDKITFIWYYIYELKKGIDKNDRNKSNSI
jgi:hypothetical protein